MIWVRELRQKQKNCLAKIEYITYYLMNDIQMVNL